MLLQVENAAPRLLRTLAQSGDADTLAVQLDRAVDVVSLPVKATLDEIHDTIAMVNTTPGSPSSRAEACCCLFAVPWMRCPCP